MPDHVRLLKQVFTKEVSDTISSFRTDVESDVVSVVALPLEVPEEAIPLVLTFSIANAKL